MAEDRIGWSKRSAFAGFDWASNHHDMVIVDREGRIVEDFRIEESAEGWQQFAQKLKAYPELAVVIETSSGTVVERLISAGCHVFPINPKAAKRYRERKAPCGLKTDRLDAWSMADALRMEGATWRQLQPDDPLTVELRVLCRDEIALIEQRTALLNQLRATLREYYPIALEAFDNWVLPSAWAFIEAFPTPQALAAAGQRRWQKFLHTHRLYHPKTYAQRMALFARAESFCGSQAMINAKSMLAVALAGQLRTLQNHLDKFRAKIEELFARHPDHDVFGSLPGTGEKLAPRLLIELGDCRERFDSPEALQCYGGTAPVSYQTGKLNKVHVRWACNKMLRHTVHLWANLSRQKCPWAEAYYRKKIAEGKKHATALRCLGQRWLKILWKMWQTRTPYNPEFHQRNQIRHGSWVIQLATQPTT
jgi:transposase